MKGPFCIQITVAAVLLLGAGFLIGRHFPSHHFERFGDSAYLYDTSSGKMCNPFMTQGENPFSKIARGDPKNPSADVALPPCGE